jgi:inosose dehydratase
MPRPADSQGNPSARSRRRFLQELGLATGAVCLGAQPSGSAEKNRALHVAANQYSWFVFYRRDQRDFSQALDDGLKDVAASGLNGFEPLVTDPKQLDELAPLLKKHGLAMRSVYVNSTLHTPDTAAKSLEEILAIAVKAKSAGARIIVTNPNPIRWGGLENKDDAQLQCQADALNRLGRKLAAMNLTLAYHHHDLELRHAAREFHHMLVGTDPKFVTLCLDCHWIYRGAGNSSVALFDVLKLYGARVSELHLRQSTQGVWSESFADGDLDYPAVARALRELKAKPHLVLEQAVETGTPKTLDTLEAHRRSVATVRRVFAGFAG